MTKIEIDLTEEQLKKVEELEKLNFSVGDAIDALFAINENASFNIENVDDDKIDIYAKIKGSVCQVDGKTKVFLENYSDENKDYDEQIHEVKTKISWAKDFFKF